MASSLPPLIGTYAERIAYSTAALQTGQWWRQTDDGPDSAAGMWLWDGGIWGYHGDVVTHTEQLTVESGLYPVVRAVRRSNVTAGGRNVFQLVSRTNGDMQSGFGGGFRFALQDADLSSPRDMGEIAVYRGASDDEATLEMRVRGAPSDTTNSINTVRVLNHKGREYITSLGDSTDGLMYGSWNKFLQYANGTAVANTVVETTLFGSGVGSLTFPANFFYVARAIEIDLTGIMGTTGTPTLQLKVKLGGSTLIDTTALTMPSGITNRQWRLWALITCQAEGASGSFRGQGRFERHQSTDGAPSTAGTTLDTTGALTLDVTATWGTANASNTIQTTNGIVRVHG